MIRFGIWLVLLLPFIYLVFGVFTNISPEPVKFIYTVSGISSLVILMLSLSISPMQRRLHVNFLKYRRLIGLFSFFYAFLHFINFAILDAELDFGFIIKESLDKPFIFLGVALFITLLLMTITSTKSLFRKYGKYHKFIYIGLIIGITHFAMAQKVLGFSQYLAILIGAILLIERMYKR